VVLDKGQEEDWFGSGLIIAATVIALVGGRRFYYA